MKSITEYDYPKQYILIENDDTKIYKIIGEDENTEEIDEYLYKVISTITEKEENDMKFTLIQHEDARLGWINLENSIQILRFKTRYYRFTADDFIANEINDKLEIVKDFKTHFTDKLLTVKSEIEFNGKRLLGVFMKDKFFGFHDEEYFEELVTCNISIPQEEIVKKELYKVSKLHEPYTEEVLFSEPKIISVFLESGIARIRANKKEFYWISLDGIEDYVSELKVDAEKDRTQKEIDDLFYAVNLERDHSKEVVKTVLSAKEYLKSKKAREKDNQILRLQSSFNNARKKNTALQNSYKRADFKIKQFESSFNNAIAKNEKLQAELNEMKIKNRELYKNAELNQKRLDQQKDYNERLTAQRDKYKERMNIVEEKLEKLTNK